MFSHAFQPHLQLSRCTNIDAVCRVCALQSSSLQHCQIQLPYQDQHTCKRCKTQIGMHGPRLFACAVYLRTQVMLNKGHLITVPCVTYCVLKPPETYRLLQVYLTTQVMYYPTVPYAAACISTTTQLQIHHYFKQSNEASWLDNKKVVPTR